MDVWLSPEPDTWVRAVFFYLPIKSVLYPLSTPTQSLSRVSVCCNDTYTCCEYGCLWDRHLGAAWVQPHREGPWNWKIAIPGWGYQGKSDCFSSSSFVSSRTGMCLFRCAHQYTEYLYLKQAWSCISYQMYLGDFLSCLNSIKAKILYRNKESPCFSDVMMAYFVSHMFTVRVQRHAQMTTFGFVLGMGWLGSQTVK